MLIFLFILLSLLSVSGGWPFTGSKLILYTQAKQHIHPRPAQQQQQERIGQKVITIITKRVVAKITINKRNKNNNKSLIIA